MCNLKSELPCPWITAQQGMKRSLIRGRTVRYLCIIPNDSSISYGSVMPDDSCAPKHNIVLPA